VSHVFVAGATGVLGRRAVAQLVAAGHEVTGVSRSDEKAALLRGLGATPAAVDLFDPGALKNAVAGHDVVANLATHIPPISKAALPGAWNENSRIRTDASRNLVDAALANGAGRYIQEAISFMYEDRGDQWIDEDVPMSVPALGESLLAAEGEAARFTAAGGVGVVLRFGQFYAPEAAHTIAMIKAARRRVSATPGPPDGYVPNIHADDAAAAVVAALGAPAGTYNVVDDEPLTKAAFDDVLADALGTKRLHRIPKVLLKAGGSKTDFYGRSLRVSNRKFKEATGWAPRYRSVREGWPAVVSAGGSPAAAG
jgi:nucleoside-diphosphate-sugar epimerase